jgi:hypothetical protein
VYTFVATLLVASAYFHGLLGLPKKPRCFRTTGVNINNLNIIWQSNKKACITGEIIQEWLRWFDGQMHGRKVVLLMDNFSAHEAAVAAVAAVQESVVQLQNTLIIWLPKNSTSRFQPLDQGIIQTWKTYWKCQWVHYMLEQYEAGHDPVATMNVLKAIRWAIQAWEIDLNTTTITRCFHKACHPLPASPIPALSTVMEQGVTHDVEIALQYLQEAPYIQNMMDINQFLHPAEETIEDSLDYLDE